MPLSAISCTFLYITGDTARALSPECVLQCVCCSMCVAVCVLQCVCCSVCVAVCVLQCVCCSVCVAVCVNDARLPLHTADCR